MKKSITSFIGILLIGAVFIGSYVLANKSKLEFNLQRSNNNIVAASEYKEVFKPLLQTTNGLTKSVTNDYEKVELAPKQNIEYYLNYGLDDSDAYVIENLKAWLNGDFSNIVEFHNYLDKLGNNMLNQVTVADTESIDAYKEYLGL